MINTLKHFILYKETHYFASFPSIVLLKDHRLLLLFRRARDSRWLLDDSDSEAQKIKYQVDHVDSRSQLTQLYLDLSLQPISVPKPLSINPEAADQDASLLMLSNGDLLLSSFSWYPIHSRLSKPLQKKGVGLYGHPDITGCYYIFWGGFTRISHDAGAHWSVHNYLPALPDAPDIIPQKRPSHGGPIRGQAIEIGCTIFLPVYQQLIGDQVSSCHLYTSIDQGTSWQYQSIIARDKQQKLPFNEPSLLSLGGHTIMAFLRNTQGDDHLMTVLSHDQGQTWGSVQESAITGHPTHPLRLSDGRIFLCYGYRHQPFGIRAQLMDASAEQLIGDEIIIRDDGFCADIGYPWAVEMPNGQILVVYYFTNEEGIRHIAGSLLNLI